MYKIVVKQFGYDEKELLAYNYEELRLVVTLAQNEYDIISVENLNCDLASEFIDEEIKKHNNKPTDLVFGIKRKNGYKNKEEDCVNLGENYPHINMY